MADGSGSRRSALKTLALCVAGVAGLWRYLTPLSRGMSLDRTITVRAEDIPADGALVLPEKGVAVIHAGTTLQALDLACTHLGCTVTATAAGFACPCHGSRFDSRGGCVSGPAARALRACAIEAENGAVRVVRAETS
jgi:Rieske Fe-S protein